MIRNHSGRIGILGLGLCVLILGCASATPSILSQANQPAANPSSPAGQMLPISAKAEIAHQTIQLEVARTPEQQELGLMYRPALPDDRGMLFPFSPPRPVLFWMKNTPEPLDMVFLLNGQVKHIAANAPPCTTAACPTYGPGTTIDQVIELRAGRAAELGLKVGDRVAIQYLPQ